MKIDYVHFYTRNVAKIKNWFVDNIGFQTVGSSQNRHTQTEAIALNAACLVFSAPLTIKSQVNQYLKNHPSGAIDIAFRVTNLTSIVRRAESLGLNIIQSPRIKQSFEGVFRYAKIQGWNELEHTLIEKIEGQLDYAVPDLVDSLQPILNYHNSALTKIDHVVLNVAAGQLKAAVELYQILFGFKIQQSFKIDTHKSGLYSQALVDETGEVKFNINEPTTQNSQIQEFIDLNHGSGIQHLALRSQNLIADVRRMQQHQIQFLTVPPSYYHNLDNSLALSPQEKAAIATHQILGDSELGRVNSPSPPLLMQIFTKPIFEQPTFFLEFIERKREAQGFGKGNFKALFEAVEREQLQ